MLNVPVTPRIMEGSYEEVTERNLKLQHLFI